MASSSLTSLISSTIAVVQATRRHYSAVNDDESLRDAFHEAGRELSPLEEALQLAKSQLETCDQAGCLQRAMKIFEACNTKAMLSETLFKDVAQAPMDSRFERYKMAVRREGKGNTVEVLVKGMMNDMCELANDSAVKAAMETQAGILRSAIDKLSQMESSVPNEQSTNNFSHYGSGGQFFASGGTQNNNTGSGNQFLGNLGGPVYFGSNPS